jgi:hypothetical protein
MRFRKLMTLAALAAFVLVVAVGLYIVLASGTLYVFASLFQPRGHPPLPDAPDGYYQIAFIGICPLVALGLSLWLVISVRAKARQRAARRRADAESSAPASINRAGARLK